MNKKGFTLIELLAVIIILGILMLIAIPSITNYINDARKQVYIDTSKELIKGASLLIGGGELDVSDDDTTYYIPYTCIPQSTSAKSPYGDFEEAYVVVNRNDSDGFDYYFYGYDETGQGIVPITNENNLDPSCIQGGINKLNTKTSVDYKSKVVVFSNNCTSVENTYKMLDKDIAADKDGKHAMFVTGEVFNTKMKTLANDLGTSLEGNKNIRYFKYSSTEPNDELKTEEHLVSTTDSEYPIYMWFEDETIYWWSEDKMPSLNSNSYKMFYGLNNLVSIEGIERFDTSEVTSMSYFFGKCKNLERLELGYWDTSKVTNFSIMFDGCEKITYIDVSNFDTSSATSINSMFRYCYKITSLDLTNWDTSNVTYFAGLFWCCYDLVDIDISNFDTSNATDMSYMFSYCKSLEYLDLSNFNTSKVTSMYSMFSKCEKLKYINITSFDTSNVTTMDYFLSECYSLTSIDLSSLDVHNITSLKSFFSSCKMIESLDISNFNTSNVTNSSSMFQGCENLKSIIFDHLKFNTSNIKDMSYMFCKCMSMESLDISFFNTSKVTNMNGMFYKSSLLTVLDLNSFTFKSNTKVDRMFEGCSSLTTIYVASNFVSSGYLTGTNIFVDANSLVGQNGTRATSLSNRDTAAKIDGGVSSPGLFSVKV